MQHPINLPDGKISCSECQQPFTLKTISVHIKAEHFNLIHNCLECDKSFLTRTSLKKHVIAAHTTERNFKCTKCPAKFKRRGDLNNHENVHSSTPKSICPHCGEKFKHEKSMSYHIKNVHEESIACFCDQCGFKSKNQHTLKRHMIRMHGGEKETFHCPHEDCEKVYKDKATLRDHVNFIHLKVQKPKTERRHSCSYCTKKFFCPSDAKKHENTFHLSKREIKCEQCEYTTNYPHSLKKHIESIHLGIMYDCYYPGCTKSYNKKGNLDAHKSRVHKIPTPKAKL